MGRDRASLTRRHVGGGVVSPVIITCFNVGAVKTRSAVNAHVYNMAKRGAVLARWWWRWQSQVRANPSIVALGADAAESADQINTSRSVEARIIPCRHMANAYVVHNNGCAD